MRRTLLLIAACALGASPAVAETKKPPDAVVEIGLAVGPWWTDAPSEGGVFIGGLFGARFFKRFGASQGEKWDTRLAIEYGGRVTFGGMIANNGEPQGSGAREENGGFAFTAVPTVQVWSRWQGIGVFARYANEAVPSGVLRDANGLVDFKQVVTTGGPMVSVGIHHSQEAPGVVIASFRWEPLPDMRLDRFAVEFQTSLFAWLFIEYRRFGAEATDNIVRGGQQLLFSFGLSPTGIATIKPKSRRR